MVDAIESFDGTREKFIGDAVFAVFGWPQGHDDDALRAAHCALAIQDALATADLSRAELLHPVDGWHPSAEGHNVLAEAAFSDLGRSLEFLGIKSPPSDSRN